MPPEHNPEPDTTAEAYASVEVSHVIVRGCAHCGSPRQVGEACAGCGDTQPPDTVDLGVVTAEYRNPFKRLWWAVAGRLLARWRVRRANRQAARRAQR